MNTLLLLCFKTIAKVQKPSFLLSFFIVLFSFQASAQCPILDAGPDQSIECGGSDATLEITINGLPELIFPNTGTNTYRISIPECPLPPLTGNPTNINIDDTFSSVFPLEFDFEYYTNTYSNFVVGANGKVTFDTSLAGDFDGWSIDDTELLPFVDNSSFFLNMIYGAFHDMNPGVSGEINYFITGTAPERVLVVNFNNVPHFGSSCDSVFFTTQQIILFESTNIIQVNLIEKPFCTAWNDGLATLGIQGNNLGEFAVPTDRNTGVWEAIDETYYFIPDGTVDPNSSFEVTNLTTGLVVATSLPVTVSPTETTTYSVALTFDLPNGTPVTLEDQVVVTVSSNFSVDLGENQQLCETPSYDITAEVIDGNPADATFLWNTGETTQTITVTATGTYTVEVTIADCTVIESVDVFFNEVPAIDLGNDIATCLLDSITLDATPSNYNIADVTFQWSLDGNVLAGETSNTLAVTATGEYSVVVDYQGCIGEDTIIVSPANDIDISLGEDFSSCFNELVTLDATPTNYDPSTAMFEWSFNGTVLTGETSATLIAQEPGNYSVLVTVGVCTAEDTVIISPSNDIEIALGDNFESCFVEEIILDATPANYDPTLATYEWRLNGTLIAGETNATLMAQEPGTYTVLVAIGACTGQDSIIISPSNDIEIALGDDFETCFDEGIILDASPANYDPALGTYQWSLNGTLLPNETLPTLIVTESGSYSVTVSIGACIATDSIVISGRDDLIVTVNEDFKTCPDEVQILTATTSETNVAYQWYLNGDVIVGATDSTLEIAVTSSNVGEQIYSVTISVGDCTGTDAVSVVLYDVGKCTVSEGLSPNGDGLNDCLDLEFIRDRAGAFSVEIFNRYGMSVFKQDNYVNEFCGIDQDGNELTTGTYFYVMKFPSTDPVYGSLKTGWIYINKEVN
ncbi:MAG: gliding motility-associated C-terminal domain-containing protein [Flavobacteriaceae bacterium]